MHYVDILIFAAIAVYLVIQLRSVLGRRTGNERPPQWGRQTQQPSQGDAVPPAADNVIDLASARGKAAEPVQDGPLAAGIALVRSADPSFDLNPFLLGARRAFEMIVDAYARGDLAGLRPLLSDPVFSSFAAAIEAREKAGHVLETEIYGLRRVEALSVRLDGSIAQVCVRFQSEQINVLKDPQGRVIEGDAQDIVDVVDDWTFERDTRAKDPNWILTATHAATDGTA